MRKSTKTYLSLILVLLLGLGLLQPLLDAAQALPAGSPAEPADWLRITELMHKNKASLRDEDGDFPDWIELENISDKPGDLSGWRLSDGKNKEGWSLPARSLAPGERLLVFADGKDRAEGELHGSFSLSEGETICLFSPDGRLADTAVCSGKTADVALARGEDGSFSETRFPTPGFPNNAAGFDAWQESLGPAAGPLVIAEAVVFERKARFSTNYDYGNCDWVEIKNISDEAVELKGWRLSDDDDDLSLWQFPDRKLSAGASLLLRCSELGSAPGDTADICTGFALSSEAEQLYLSAPDGTLVDYAALRAVPYSVSYGRVDGEAGWFYFEDPSPGKPNGAGCRRISTAPVSAERDGVYEDVESVTVELRAEGEIHYTLDGSLPTRGSKLYEEPLTLEKTTVLRAIAVEEGALPSPALSLSYFINEGHSLPVLSLLTNAPGSFRKMYDSGQKNQVELASLALYEEDGGFCIPCEVKLNGETSLVLAKKNMSIRFRRAYGAGPLEYDCFGGGLSSFTNLLLRSGQDYSACIFKNELVSNLAGRATDRVLVPRSRYCVLYINGKYNGIYALMEKTNEQMYADYTGTSRESVTVYEASVSEHSAFYREVVGPALSTDLRKEENYQAIADALDIESLIDWIIIEGWCANKDLQSGNLRYARSSENDGKWRLMLYDLDAVFSSTEVCFDVLSPFSRQSRQIGQLIDALLRNADFRAQLLSRAAELLNGPLSDEALLAEIDRLSEELDPEVARNHARLGLEKSKWIRNVGYLRRIITDGRWQESCINALCTRIGVKSAERAQYFGS